MIEMVHAMRKASGQPVLYDIGPRREGDIAVCYADPAKATKHLGWSATRNLDDMCRGKFLFSYNYFRLHCT